jgi:hypothetical protein
MGLLTTIRESAVPSPHTTALILALAGSLGAPCASAAEPRSYAILSLVGDSISTVLERLQTGSRLDQNEKQLIPIADKVFDVAAIEAANAIIKKTDPQAQTALLVTPDPGLYKAQNAMFDSAAAHADDRTFLKSLLTKRAITHLVLVTKLRADADIWLKNAPISTGKIEGLGYYMNNSIRITDLDSLNNTSGILAPFAYIKLRLIDAATLEVVKEVTEKHACPVGNFAGTRASWDALNSAQKVEYLSQTLQDAVGKAMPRLLQ